MVSEQFTEQTMIRVDVLKALTKLYSLVMHAIKNQGKTFAVVGLHEKVAERNVPVYDFKTICFTTNPTKYKERGFIPIKLNVEPFRLGASLRTIVMAIIDVNINGETITWVGAGGRPGAPTMFVERLIAYNNLATDTKYDGVNMCVGYWSTYHSYHDGLIKRKPWKNIGTMIANNVNYASLYGIDEVFFRDWENDIIFGQSDVTFPYSNLILSAEYSEFHEKWQDIKTLNNYDFNDFPYDNMLIFVAHTIILVMKFYAITLMVMFFLI